MSFAVPSRVQICPGSKINSKQLKVFCMLITSCEGENSNLCNLYFFIYRRKNSHPFEARLKLRVFVVLVLRANITEYSQSDSSHVRLPLQGIDRSIESTTLSHWVYFLTVDVCQWIFPPVHASVFIPWTGRKLFARKSNSLADKNRGNLTNWWPANCSEIWTTARARAVFVSLAITLSSGGDDKKHLAGGLGSKFRSIAVANVRAVCV